MVIISALFFAIIFQGSRGLYETTEGRYAECARETLNSGNLLEPMLSGEHHWTKPPMTYICIAIGMKLFGENEWGVRAYLVLAFILTVIAVYYTGCLIWNDKNIGLLCAIVFASSPFTMFASNSVSTDMLLTLWISLAILAFWYAVRSKKKSGIVLMWLGFAVAFFTKGPPALLHLISIVIIFILLKRKDREIPNLFSIAGLLVFAIFGLGWYLLEIHYHPELLGYWLKDELVGRNVSNEFNRNPEFYKAFVMYLPTMIFGTGAWIFLVFFKRKYLELKFIKWIIPKSIEWKYISLSIIIPLVIFSISKSKLALYVLPLFIPLSLAMGYAINQLIKQNNLKMKSVVSIFCWTIVVMIIVKGAVSLRDGKPDKDVRPLSKEMSVVLKNYPQHKIYIIGKHKIAGLEFYLKEIIPVINAKEYREIAKNKSSQETPLFLIKKKNLEDKEESQLIEEITAIDKLNIREVQDYWAFFSIE